MKLSLKHTLSKEMLQSRQKPHDSVHQAKSSSILYQSIQCHAHSQSVTHCVQPQLTLSRSQVKRLGIKLTNKIRTMAAARPSDRVRFAGHGLTTFCPHFLWPPESAIIPINRLFGTHIITGTSGRRRASRGFSASTLATAKKNART